MAQSSDLLRSAGLAGEVRRNLERAAQLQPTLAAAYLGLALWHAELVHRGRMVASMIGGDRRQATANLDRAVALAPGNPTVRFQVAGGLLLLGDRAGARQQLQAALAATPTDFWQRRDQDAARAMLAGLGQ